VARMLVDKYICQWGCPVSIHSDQGKEFTAEVFLETMKTLGIQKTTTPPYNPQSNPVERFHRTLHAMMRTMMEREDANWEQYLPTAVFAYNSKVHSSTGFSPYYILMGREPRMPVDLLVRLPDEDELPVQDFVKDMRRRFLVMADFIKAQGDAQFHRNSHAYEGDREAWQPGTLVWFFLPRVVQGKPKKWTTQWVGPWTIVERIAPVLVKIKPANTEGAERVVHVSRLRVYRKGDGRVRTLPQNLHVDDDDDDEPDTVGTARVAIPIHMEIPVMWRWRMLSPLLCPVGVKRWKKQQPYLFHLPQPQRRPDSLQQRPWRGLREMCPVEGVLIWSEGDKDWTPQTRVWRDRNP